MPADILPTTNLEIKAKDVMNVTFAVHSERIQSTFPYFATSHYFFQNGLNSFSPKNSTHITPYNNLKNFLA